MKFQFLIEGLNYQKFCPICKNELIIDHESLAAVSNDIISLETGIANDIMNINSISNHIELTTDSPAAYNGLAYHRIQIECYYCISYGYTLQLILDMSPIKLTSIILNSEFLRFISHEDIFKVKNYYPLQATYLINNNVSRALPLTIFNMNNPSETIDRIKTVIPFL
jgi:hypothetical protein